MRVANRPCRWQSESVLVQKLYTHFKKTPGTHKLGVLYVVDSVTRKWMEQAKSQGQPISLAAQDGTFAAGVHRVTQLMPQFMSDILALAPEDQKVRNDIYALDAVRFLPRAGEVLLAGPGLSFAAAKKTRLGPASIASQPPRRRIDRALARSSVSAVPAVLYVMMNTHSPSCFRVGEDQEASRHLGQGPDLSPVHGQCLQGQAERAPPPK